MKGFSSRRMAGYAALLLTLVVGAVFAVASAQAAPLKKKFDAYVVAASPDSTSFRLTLVNYTLSQQTLGSANFSAPGLNIAPVALTAVVADGGHNWSVCTGSGGVLCGDGANNIVEFRAASSGDALQPGESVSFTVSVADPTGCQNATWAVAAKQSNDFSGTNNEFKFAAGDLTPLGSFAFASVDTNGQLVPAPIETIQDGVHVPQIVVNKATPIKITALDTCKHVDIDYPNYRDFSTPTLNPITGLVPPPPSLSDFSPLSWTNGVGSATVTPTDVEVGDQFSVNDLENGIFANSSSTISGQPPQAKPTFDVVETICAKPLQTCTWQDKQNPGVTATSTVPDGNNGQALGLGYKAFATGDLCSLKPPLGDSIEIDPWQYPGAFWIYLKYAKSIVPNGGASSFLGCKFHDDTQTWVALDPCAKVPVASCFVSSNLPGGALQIAFYLDPTDPRSGGF